MADIDYVLGLERGILGICLLEPTALLYAEQYLKPVDFSDRRHARIYEVMIDLRKREAARGPVELGLEIQRLGASSEVSAELISELIEDPASLDPRSLDERLKRLRDEVDRRTVEAAFEEAKRTVRDRSIPLASTLAAIRRTTNAAEKAQTSKELSPITDVADEMLTQIDTGWPIGTPTCIPTLDWAIQGGIKPSQFVVLAGWTGSGKTSLSTQIAVRVANWANKDLAKNGWVLIFSFEMGREELVARFVMQAAPLADGFRPPAGFSNRDKPKVRMALSRIRELPIRIEDASVRTVEAVRAATERFIVEHGIPALVIVDHIHLMKDPRVRGGRSEEIASITGDLKSMAQQLKVPILALAQMNREVGKRDTHEPQITDLKESGSVEQDANVVLMVHRPSAFYTDPAQRALEEERGAEAWVYVAKNRSGPTGKVRFDWIGPRYLFREDPEAVAKLGTAIASEGEFDLSIGAEIIEDPDPLPILGMPPERDDDEDITPPPSDDEPPESAPEPDEDELFS